jgi:pyruvate dehydrogenase E2 component (dihydrolipoamide acetyltransferase)
MATKVHMEALSPTMEKGQIVKWHKSEGDQVSIGEILAEIETDKAVMELVARGAGVLRKIFKGESETSPVGDVIAVIAEEGEDISALTPSVGGTSAVPNPPKPQSDREIGTNIRHAEQAAEGRLKASPLARRLAQEAGLALSGIVGSGPGGRIVKRDVEETSHHVPAAAIEVDGRDFDDLKVSKMRKTIARRLGESLGPVPHFFLTVDVDMVRAVEARAHINALLEGRGEKISLNDLVVRAVAAALRQHPAVNAAWHGDHIRRYARVHIGVAVAVEDGLITPVVRDAHMKGVAEVAREIRELAGRAREKRLKPEEYTGATFSISNLGMFGIHEFTAIINPPEAGIVAVGQVEDVPVAVNGEVVVRPRMKVTMGCDHRVVDGATGARFLQTLTAMLEEPATILL